LSLEFPRFSIDNADICGSVAALARSHHGFGQRM